MKQVTRGGAGFILWGVVIVLLSAPVCDANEVFLVSGDGNGIANYMLSNGDESGSFISQEDFMLMGDDGLYPMGEKKGTDYFGFGVSNGNGIGDFDNDGDLDYVMGHGIFGGDIFLFEKIDSGNQFEEPVAVAGWSTGFFPMDMAVADFNNDDKLDFVMAYDRSSNCGLYLGDGSLGFTGLDPDDPAKDHVLLEKASPGYSAGVDAADFNNDGNADFVIAPYTDRTIAYEPFFVNIGDGNGNFETYTFEGATDDDGNLAPYFGVAAADFNNDGNADIAASYYGYLDIYEGNGEGDFEWVARHAFDLKLSPLDNYDFDGDGNQDLVAANYGPANSSLGRSAVAIFIGNGDGTFAEPVLYEGGNNDARSAVSAPPAPAPESNKEPVAVVDPVHLEVTVGEEILFDGSASYDEDGQIVSYGWDFGDGTNIEGFTAALSLFVVNGDTDEARPSHIYYDAGKYTVTLKVTDDKGATATVQAEVVARPVAATVQFKPYTLYLKSRDRWVWATVRLPEGFDARQIDDSSVCIVFPDGSRICAYTGYGRGFFAQLRKRFFRRKSALTVRFNRRDLIPKLQIPSENIMLTVRGNVPANDGWVEFEGSGTIRTKERKEDFWGRYWKKQMHHFSKRGGSTCRK
jgi:PKD repeat protein